MEQQQINPLQCGGAFVPPVLKIKLESTIQKYLDIPNVENININKPGEVFWEVSGGVRNCSEDPNLTKTNLSDLAEIIAAYNGIQWKSDEDTLSAKLPDGTRVEVYKTSSVTSGFSMSLRKRKSNNFTIVDFGITGQQERKLIEAVRERKNILLSGGTSTGKTSLLEILAQYIPAETRLITIQDPIEISFAQPNRLDLAITTAEIEKRVKELSDICMTAMRQNPDSIIFGEIREKTMAYTYRTASNTGHDGCMATIHANNTRAALERLTNLVYAAEGGDKTTIHKELYECIDIVIQLTKSPKGMRTAEIDFLKMRDRE